MAYKHGIYVSEVPSSVRAAVKSDAGIQAIIGTAPVNLLKDPYHAANIPMLFYTMAEAQNAIGYSTDFKAYTICGSLSASFEIANVSPVIVINVLDPNKAEHTDDVPENVVQVNDGTARLDTIGLLLDKLVVKADDVTLESGTDYTAAFNDDGTVTLVVLPDGKGAGKTQLTVSGKRIAPEKVKGKDVIGGVSVDGKETGMEVLPSFSETWCRSGESGCTVVQQRPDLRSYHAGQDLDAQRHLASFLLGRSGQLVHRCAEVHRCADSEDCAGTHVPQLCSSVGLPEGRRGAVQPQLFCSGLYRAAGCGERRYSHAADVQHRSQCDGYLYGGRRGNLPRPRSGKLC
jgi:hypothetical protein